MVVDLFLLLFLVLGFFKGWTKGLIMAVFEFFSFFVALALALQFSGLVEGYLKAEAKMDSEWLSFLAFVLVLIGAIISIRILGKLVEKSVELLLLGLVNRIGGILVYLFLYLALYSVVLVYLKRFDLIGEETPMHSKSFPYLINFGGWVIDLFAEWLPSIKNLFNETKEFIKQTT